jgi:hypothetical protein
MSAESTTEDNAIAEANKTAIAQFQQPNETTGFNLNELEPAQRLEMIQDIIAIEHEIEANALPQYKSSDILNRPLNILDAAFRQIPDAKTEQTKACVSFVCEWAEGDKEAGQQFTVLKGSNPFNDAFANRFTKLRGIMEKPLMGYEFVEDARYKKAGNTAIILRRRTSFQTASKK